MERSQGHHHTRPTTCAAPVVQPPAILPPSHSRHCQDGHRIHVLIVVPSIAACIATALSKARKSSRILSGSMSGFGPRSLQRIDSARRQTLWIFTLTWCGGFAQTRVKGFCVMTLSRPPTCVSCDDQPISSTLLPCLVRCVSHPGSPSATSLDTPPKKKSPVASFDRSIAPSLYNNTNTHITAHGIQSTDIDHVVL